MGDHNQNPEAMSSSVPVPPGIRFYPSDEQLLCYYLTNKNRTIIRNTDDDENDNGNLNGYNLMKELDLYDYEPFDLPENACYAYGYKGRKRHWYCYTKVRVLKRSRGGGEKRRRAKGGFWRRSGGVRDVVDNTGKVVVGTRTRFVFYLGNSTKSAVRTDWLLYEYALVDHVKASFALCRVFFKSRGGNSRSENVISSCAEESVSTVRHIGIQHDGFLTPDIAEAKVHNDNSADTEEDLSRYSVRLSRELDDQVTARPISVDGFQSPSGVQSKEPVRTSGLTGGNMFVDTETVQYLQSILEDDFIELDDLMD